MAFDPNAAALKDSGIFGLPFDLEESKLVLLPVSWEATTSYGGGTAQGPKAILQASKQIDLYDADLGDFYRAGIYMLDAEPELLKWNESAQAAAQRVINEEAQSGDIELVDQYSEKINDYVYQQTKQYLANNKIVGIVGGDHSVPLGAIKAYLEKYPEMGILHIDAHADLRKSFEGFKYSHASIMYNVIQETKLKKLVQTGIRDYCNEEMQYILHHEDRITTFFDVYLQEMKMLNITWPEVCEKIIESLPQAVYISFDIDGLDPQFCPNVGTPVPGGLSYYEVLMLFKILVKSGRKIIGFDLNEVSIGNIDVEDVTHPAQEWDANVAARLLYKMCGWCLS